MRLVVTNVLSSTAAGMILSAKDESGRAIRIQIREPREVAVGDVVEVEGEERSFVDDRGEHAQIEARTLHRSRTTGRLIGPWLQTLPGIGRTRARRLIDTYGENLLETLRSPAAVEEVARVLDPHHPELGIKLARLLYVEIVSRDAGEEVALAEGDFLLRLEELGVDDLRAARRLWRLIGSIDAYDRLIKQPYLAASVLPWRQADAIGRAVLTRRGGPTLAEAHPDRLVGAVDATWREILARGSTAAHRRAFAHHLASKVASPASAISEALPRRRAIEDGELLRAPGAAYLERVVAAHIGRLRQQVEPTRPIEAQLQGLTEEQRSAVRHAGRLAISIIHGGAGVGKTTTMKAVCRMHEAAGRKVVLAAISGKAALRLARATGRLACTVARLLTLRRRPHARPAEPEGRLRRLRHRR